MNQMVSYKKNFLSFCRKYLDEVVEGPPCILAHLIAKKKLNNIPVFRSDPPEELCDGRIRHYFVETESYLAKTSKYCKEVTWVYDDYSSYQPRYLIQTCHNAEMQVIKLPWNFVYSGT